MIREELVAALKVLAKPSVVATGTEDEWFFKLPKEKQKEYIKEHPKSKFAHKVGKHVEKHREKVKDWHKDQKEFFAGPGAAKSKERRSVSDFMKDKAAGVVKSIKHELKEYKTAGKALHKMASKQEISDHEKKAVRTVLVHSALVLGPMAVTGGLSGSIGHVLPAIATHFMQHSAALTALKVAAYATTNESKTDKMMEDLIHKFADYVAEQDFTNEEWVKFQEESLDE